MTKCNHCNLPSLPVDTRSAKSGSYCAGLCDHDSEVIGENEPTPKLKSAQSEWPSIIRLTEDYENNCGGIFSCGEVLFFEADQGRYVRKGVKWGDDVVGHPEELDGKFHEVEPWRECPSGFRKVE